VLFRFIAENGVTPFSDFWFISPFEYWGVGVPEGDNTRRYPCITQ
jgi:hypothetical protein